MDEYLFINTFFSSGTGPGTWLLKEGLDENNTKKLQEGWKSQCQLK